MGIRGILAAAAAVIGFSGVIWAGKASAQAYPPGTFSVDGIPVVCGPVWFVVTPQVPDVGMADGQGRIFLNPMFLAGLPTPLKLYWVAHECGHYFVGANEVAADCWAMKVGKAQGWFPPQAFQAMMVMFQNNPGDMAHPSGRQRVANMMGCYNAN